MQDKIFWRTGMTGNFNQKQVATEFVKLMIEKTGTISDKVVYDCLMAAKRIDEFEDQEHELEEIISEKSYVDGEFRKINDKINSLERGLQYSMQLKRGF